MKKMKVSALALTLMVAMVLAGCGAGQSEVNATVQANAIAEQTTEAGLEEVTQTIAKPQIKLVTLKQSAEGELLIEDAEGKTYKATFDPKRNAIVYEDALKKQNTFLIMTGQAILARDMSGQVSVYVGGKSYPAIVKNGQVSFLDEKKISHTIPLEIQLDPSAQVEQIKATTTSTASPLTASASRQEQATTVRSETSLTTTQTTEAPTTKPTTTPTTRQTATAPATTRATEATTTKATTSPTQATTKATVPVTQPTTTAPTTKASTATPTTAATTKATTQPTTAAPTTEATTAAPTTKATTAATTAAPTSNLRYPDYPADWTVANIRADLNGMNGNPDDLSSGFLFIYQTFWSTAEVEAYATAYGEELAIKGWRSFAIVDGATNDGGYAWTMWYTP